MATQRTPLYVRLPRTQAAALDRLARTTGRPKQHLVSELLADRLAAGARQLVIGRVETTTAADVRADEVLTLEEVAALLKLPPDAVRARAEAGDVPGRRFGRDWRFARLAVLAWLADGDTPRQRRSPQT